MRRLSVALVCALLLAAPAARGRAFDELFFEVTRFSLSGFSPLAEASGFAPVSRMATVLLSRKLFDPRTGTCLLFAELGTSPYVRERVGMIESTRAAADLVPFGFAARAGADAPDDGSCFFSWIDRVLAVAAPPEAEPGFPTGDEILSLIEGMRESLPERTEEEMGYFDRNGNIRKYASAGERFFVDGRTYVNTFGSGVARYTYDESYRLLRSEKFEMGSSSRDLRRLSARTFTYAPGSEFPSKGVEEDFAESTRTNSLYDGRGLRYLRETFRVGADGKLSLEKKTGWTYDELGRMTSEESVEYSRATDAAGRRRTERFRTRHELVYTDFPAPDKRYYEDGALRVSRTFTAENDYDETVYFDEGFRVVLRHEDGIRKTEIVYFGDQEVRRRNLEK